MSNQEDLLDTILDLGLQIKKGVLQNNPNVPDEVAEFAALLIVGMAQQGIKDDRVTSVINECLNSYEKEDQGAITKADTVKITLNIEAIASHVKPIKRGNKTMNDQNELVTLQLPRKCAETLITCALLGVTLQEATKGWTEKEQDEFIAYLNYVNQWKVFGQGAIVRDS